MPINPHVNHPIIDKFCLWLIEYNNRNSYYIYGDSSYHSFVLCIDVCTVLLLIVSSWTVTKVTAINRNCIKSLIFFKEKTKVWLSYQWLQTLNVNRKAEDVSCKHQVHECYFRAVTKLNHQVHDCYFRAVTKLRKQYTKAIQLQQLVVICKKDCDLVSLGCNFSHIMLKMCITVIFKCLNSRATLTVYLVLILNVIIYSNRKLEHLSSIL